MSAGKCRICGRVGEGTPFKRWVRPTFTDHDKLLPGDIVCEACDFWFAEKNPAVSKAVGKWWATAEEAMKANEPRVAAFFKKAKREPLPEEIFEPYAGGWCIPQKARNYSHFEINGVWVPLSKGQKAEMRSLLTTSPFPELAVVADSGQKHIWFRAQRNAPNASAGWVQFEEETVWVDPRNLSELLTVFEELMLGFGKGQIESGEYYQQIILQFGFDRWRRLEKKIKPHRGGVLLKLVSFLAQKPDEDTAVLPPAQKEKTTVPQRTPAQKVAKAAPPPSGQLSLFG